jgi:hypothetical protein
MARLEADLRSRSFAAMLSSPYDKDERSFAITLVLENGFSGLGLAMLQRMYVRWAERRGFIAEVLDSTRVKSRDQV